MTPLVSVLMPCYNAVATLPVALASIRAQSYTNWECIVVDDGSNDGTPGILPMLQDCRFRSFSLERNRGRGFARQFALEQARGEFVAMLDADDWIYPWKLAGQVEVLQAEPDISVLSTGMAIVNAEHAIEGVRNNSIGGSALTIFGCTRRPVMPSIAFAPSMIRAEVARRFRFDKSLRFSEDADFLISLLMRNRYAALSRIGYTYSEHASVTLEKIIGTLAVERRIFAKYRPEFPLTSRTHMIAAGLKSAAYRASSAVGLWAEVIRRRSRTPSASQIADFQAARAVVAAEAGNLFAKHQ